MQKMTTPRLRLVTHEEGIPGNVELATKLIQALEKNPFICVIPIDNEVVLYTKGTLKELKPLVKALRKEWDGSQK